MPGRLEGVVLPGPELEGEASRRPQASTIVLRVARVYPHGTAFRYDLEYYGLEPGTHDLRDLPPPPGRQARRRAAAARW